MRVRGPRATLTPCPWSQGPHPRRWVKGHVPMHVRPGCPRRQGLARERLRAAASPHLGHTRLFFNLGIIVWLAEPCEERENEFLRNGNKSDWACRIDFESVTFCSSGHGQGFFTPEAHLVQFPDVPAPPARPSFERHRAQGRCPQGTRLHVLKVLSVLDCCTHNITNRQYLCFCFVLFFICTTLLSFIEKL